MKNYYKVYNEHLFGNKLPDIPVVVVPFSEVDEMEEASGYDLEKFDLYAITFAEHEDEGNKVHGILMNDELPNQEETLLHEMIHVWQIINRRDRGHGKEFKKCIKFLRDVFPEWEETLV